MVPREVIVQRILLALPGARVEIEDTTGTSDHFEAVVEAAQFAGKTLIEQHKMVYAALGELITAKGGGAAIHALQLKTMTPAAAGVSTHRAEQRPAD